MGQSLPGSGPGDQAAQDFRGVTVKRRLTSLATTRVTRLCLCLLLPRNTWRRTVTRFSCAIVCSTTIRCLDTSRLCPRCSSLNSALRGFLCGNTTGTWGWYPPTPTYPLSAIAPSPRPRPSNTPLSTSSARSCVEPGTDSLTASICPRGLTTTCVLTVFAFFLPE